MIVPYTVDVPMERIPFTNWILIGLTIFASGLILIDRAIDDDAVFDVANVRPYVGALQPNDFNPLQLITHLFVHGDVFHLVGNMIFLFVFGNAVNAKLGHGLFLLCYFSIGALAGVGWLFVGKGVPAVGASGAIMGLMGMFFVFFPRNEVYVWYWVGWSLMGTLEVASYWIVIFYLSCDLVGTLVELGTPIAYIVHLIGAFVGFTLACTFLVTRAVRPNDDEENLLQVMDIMKKRPDDYW
ncbi:MAG: rhomboid family intramembrane serine protease, partial [Gemmataceae bacterium]|nr:rhomboid family intramembrane serine protease [Gemmataceae bacterium]